MTSTIIETTPKKASSRAWRKLRKDPAGIIPIIILILLISMVIIGPFLYKQNPQKTNALATLESPSAEHWLGTDELGRDVFARILVGGRVSLAVGLLSMLVGLTLGTIVGGSAGYFGGRTEAVLMRLVDMFMAIPSFFLILVIVTSFGNHPAIVIMTVGLAFWAQMARVVFAEFAKFKKSDFVEASQALGGSHTRIMVRHIFPQVLPQAIVLATLGVGWSILTEAALSYLGLGIQPPLASWGNILQNAQQYLFLKPTLAIWPGLFIALTVLMFNLIGNTLRDVFDPRS